jgi:hypothetical protein
MDPYTVFKKWMLHTYLKHEANFTKVYYILLHLHFHIWSQSVKKFTDSLA